MHCLNARVQHFKNDGFILLLIDRNLILRIQNLLKIWIRINKSNADLVRTIFFTLTSALISVRGEVLTEAK